MIFLILIVIFMIIIETFFLFDNLKSIRNENLTKDDIIKYNATLFGQLREHVVKKDVFTEHLPGRLFIKEDHNIFIICGEKIELMKKNIIYDIKTRFNVDVLNLTNKDIRYFYI